MSADRDCPRVRRRLRHFLVPALGAAVVLERNRRERNGDGRRGSHRSGKRKLAEIGTDVVEILRCEREVTPELMSVPSPRAVYDLAFGLLGAINCALLVELRDASDAVLKTIKDIDYQREDQNDTFNELFRITVA